MMTCSLMQLRCPFCGWSTLACHDHDSADQIENVVEDHLIAHVTEMIAG